MKRASRSYFTVACLAIVLVSAGSFARGESADVVEFDGSRMVGEVKRLDRGKLHFKTDATNTIEIDWAKVTKLITSQRLRIEQLNGDLVLASLASGAESGKLALVSGDITELRPLAEVVSFEPIAETFWDRLDIKTSLGYSFMAATDNEQIGFAASFEYDTDLRWQRFNVSLQSSESENSGRAVRRSVDWSSLRMATAPYFWGFLGAYEDSDALNLDYRVLGGVVGGREVFPLSNRRIRAYAGFVVSGQQNKGASSSVGLEAPIGGMVDWYRFQSPELDLSSSLIFFPSLTDIGRWRSRLNINLHWEIFENLYWDLSFFNDQDSGSGGGEEAGQQSVNDYGVTTGVGWSW